MKSERIFASWYMTEACNYDCNYCNAHYVGAPKEHLPTEKIINTLKQAGGKWTLGVTGGEPFLFPNFIELCKALKKEGIKIAVDTNLSIASKVREFIDLMDAEDVEYLFISTHIVERERKGGVGEFQKLLMLLKEKKYNCFVNYVMYPALFKRFNKDRESFKSIGIELKAKPFEGVYKGRSYPDGYTLHERKKIMESNPDAFGMAPFRSKGVKCNAGRYLVRIDSDGTVYRCMGERTVLGNILDKITLYNEAQPCDVAICPCMGAKYVEDPAVIGKLREEFILKYRRTLLKRAFDKGIRVAKQLLKS